MPHRVIDPPDIQCSNLHHVIENIFVIISVEKYKEKNKWEIYGELFKILIY